jgi:hypothetical protein
MVEPEAHRPMEPVSPVFGGGFTVLATHEEYPSEDGRLVRVG